MRWPGFRKVRRQVCRRVERRLDELGLREPRDYRRFLEAHPEEWRRLDSMCTISISRFYRDKDVFQILGRDVLPALAERAHVERRDHLRFWSAGCASGEEPYTLALVWKLELEKRFPRIQVDITATDSAPHLIERANAARYPKSSLKLLPEAWIRSAFEPRESQYVLRPEFRRRVTFLQQDIRAEMPPLPPPGWDLILCRNVVFTYFEAPLQREILAGLVSALVSNGVLVIGRRETLPADEPSLRAWSDRDRGIFYKLPER
jgi:chemotaxis protein methyltransferase CheR